ncbi:MAG: ABC transporter permease [Betaproteobacteria bacterium]|nr:ABC transporter permease [Betaproteobacteria bacterium]MDH5219866.1 ABC transporter permease [Betaproteobacteria bacterium]MDH5349318.1 ABC transporter permease [Betaproteobacteria bacterium]
MPASLLLARATLLEARRSGLPWLALGLLAAALGLAVFLSQVAVTESRELQAAFAAALLRAGAAFLLATHVATSLVREANDKVLELALALPLSRSEYYLGKLAGYGAAGLGLALVFSLPLLLWSGPAGVALWGASLALELLLVCAASLFFALTLAQVVPALAAVAGLYLLGRAIASIQLLARGPLVEENWLQWLSRGAVDAVALLLPRLDAATKSEWLLYGPPSAAEYGMSVAGLVVYAALLAAAGMFDFHRRNL